MNRRTVNKWAIGVIAVSVVIIFAAVVGDHSKKPSSDSVATTTAVVTTTTALPSTTGWTTAPATNWATTSTNTKIWTPPPVAPLSPSTTTPAPDDHNAAFLAAVRAAGAVGTDNDLSADGMAVCLDLDQGTDTAIEVSAQLTQAPYNFSQHVADEIVINAVLNICPNDQSKIDNPTG